MTQQQPKDRAVRGFDSVTGTRDDAYRRLSDGSPASHRYGRHATQLTNEEAYVAAENYIRSSQQFRDAVTRADSNGENRIERVASGQVDNRMTAEQYRALEAWRSEALQRQAADEIEISNRAQQARHQEGFGSFVDGLTRGDFSDNDSWSRTGGQIVGGLIPGYGQVADARDTAAALRDVWQGREGAGANLLLAGVGWVPLVGDSIKGGARVVRRGVLEVTEGASTRLLRAVPEDVLVGAMRQNFSARRMQFGSHTFQLDHSGMRHILERHHPNYWNGTVRGTQTFLDSHMSIQDVGNAVEALMRQNRDTLMRAGTNDSVRMSGTYNGVEYSLTVDNGRAVQFYPTPRCEMVTD